MPPKIDHVASAKKLADGTYEIRLRYSETISGGPCFNSSFFKSTTYHYADLIYLKSLEGYVSANQLAVKAGAQDTQWGIAEWEIKDLQGMITFTNGVMLVQLEQPDYDYKKNAQRGYVSYYLNGTYQITNDISPAATAH
ncbi:MAG TPA: hypothetical protein VGI63_07700 [Verrucomicrobiae bacterium]